MCKVTFLLFILLRLTWAKTCLVCNRSWTENKCIPKSGSLYQECHGSCGLCLETIEEENEGFIIGNSENAFQFCALFFMVVFRY